MIKAFAKAHKWKRILDEGDATSLAGIATTENVTGAYISRIFNLNFMAPEIVEKILSGQQPRTLKLQDMLYGDVPLLWQEQNFRCGAFNCRFFRYFTIRGFTSN